MTQSQRADLSRWISVVCILTTFLISRNLWLANHALPMIPAIPMLKVLPDAIANVLFFIMFGMILLFGFYPKPAGFMTILAIILLLVQTDINRLQPATFIYVLTLFCHCFPKRRVILLIFVFSGVYFWSGIHKWNPYFLETWLRGMNKRIGFTPLVLRQAFTYAVPFIEAAAGLMLLNLRFRKIGVILLVVMHFLILTTLFAENFGMGVLPWNLLMISTLLLVIFPSDAHVVALFDKKAAAITAIVWLLPVANLFGYYDHFLSFSIMSGKPEYAYYYFPDGLAAAKVPEPARPYIRQYQGKYYIQLTEWAGYAKGIMVYPEERVYNSIKDSLTCRMSEKEKNQTQLQLYKP